MKNKTKYYLFITLLVFLGLIVAAALLVSTLLIFNVFFANGIKDLVFVPQFAILAVVYFLIFPAIMVLASNVYFKTSGKKTWGNWLTVALNYNSVFTVIAVYQCAFAVIEVLVLFNIIISSSNAFDIIIRVIIFTVPFMMFFFSKKILKKLFGGAEIEGVCETGDQDITDPKDFTIRQPLYALVLYIVVSVFLLFMLGVCIWMNIDYDFSFHNLIPALIFLPIVLLGPFLIIIWNRWKLVIKDNQISFTSYFGRTKSCVFGDITRVKQRVRNTKIGTIYNMTAYHEKKKLFFVASNSPGYDVLAQRFKDEGLNIEW